MHVKPLHTITHLITFRFQIFESDKIVSAAVVFSETRSFPVFRQIFPVYEIVEACSDCLVSGYFVVENPPQIEDLVAERICLRDSLQYEALGELLNLTQEKE